MEYQPSPERNQNLSADITTILDAFIATAPARKQSTIRKNLQEEFFEKQRWHFQSLREVSVGDMIFELNHAEIAYTEIGDNKMCLVQASNIWKKTTGPRLQILATSGSLVLAATYQDIARCDALFNSATSGLAPASALLRDIAHQLTSHAG